VPAVPLYLACLCGQSKSIDCCTVMLLLLLVFVLLQMRNASHAVGDTSLEDKFEASSKLLRRGSCLQILCTLSKAADGRSASAAVLIGGASAGIEHSMLYSIFSTGKQALRVLYRHESMWGLGQCLHGNTSCPGELRGSCDDRLGLVHEGRRLRCRAAALVKTQEALVGLPLAPWRLDGDGGGNPSSSLSLGSGGLSACGCLAQCCSRSPQALWALGFVLQALRASDSGLRRSNFTLR